MRFRLASTVAVVGTVLIVVSSRGYGTRALLAYGAVALGACVVSGVTDFWAQRVMPTHADPLTTLNLGRFLGFLVIAVAAAISGFVLGDDVLVYGGSIGAAVLAGVALAHYRSATRTGD